MAEFTGIGLMCGTSLDGIDLAAVRFIESGDEYQAVILQCQTLPIGEEMTARIRNAPASSASELALLHADFGRRLGELTSEFIRLKNLEVDFAASHGCTIFHQPENGFGFQAGDGELLASHLSVPIVNNFRSKDIALGGEGAPLVPFGEKYLLKDHKVFLNLGGICNVGYKGMGFDVCVCNMALNYLAGLAQPGKTYDPSGEFARSGSLDDALLKTLNDNAFFSKKPPKSLGWEWFSATHLPILKDYASTEQAAKNALRTYTEHIAIQIKNAIPDNQAQQYAFITGGGAHNSFLMERISENGVRIAEIQDSRWIDFKEAIIFAFLGLRVLRGKTNTLASVTGAKMDACCGSIHLPPQGGFAILGFGS